MFCALAMLATGGLAADDTATTETQPAPEGMRVLHLELPKPMFVGTPKDLRSPNLEPPRKGPRPTFYVPEGAENLAADREVTSSDMMPIIGDLELITDGDKEAEEGSFVELGPLKQWVQIDLGESAKLHAIVLWHYHQQPRVYRDVVVQVSEDPDFISDVKTIYNNDHDNSSGLGIGKDKEYIETFEGRIIDAKGAEGRYLRFYSNGSTASDENHYTEIEIYGTMQ